MVVIKFNFYSPKISETTFIPKGENVSNSKSHAVILNSKYSKVKFEENNTQLNFSQMIFQ